MRTAAMRTRMARHPSPPRVGALDVRVSVDGGVTFGVPVTPSTWPVGWVDGAVLGCVEGAVLEAIEGAVLGSLDGAVDGAVLGGVLGAVEGGVLGSPAGQSMKSDFLVSTAVLSTLLPKVRSLFG